MLSTMAIWAGVFLVSLISTLVLTRLRERRRGMPFWSPVKRRILATILPSFAAAGGLTFAIAGRFWFWPMAAVDGWDIAHQIALIPAVWMLFYGITLWELGQFAPIEVKLLGVCFIAAGLVTAGLFQWHFYWTMGITFGGFHIVYGVVVWLRHGG
jgi:hypothetical protein